MLGLTIDIVGRLGPSWGERMNTFARAAGVAELPGIGGDLMSPSTVLRQLTLTAGALLLFIAALSQGRKGRLFQILEAALVVYGVLSFFPLPLSSTTLVRVGVSVAMFVALWRMKLLEGRIAKVGAAGLEALGLGYLFGSYWFFMVGGIFLTIYCGYFLAKEPSLLNGTWTALNGAFGAAAAVVLLLNATPSLSVGAHAFLAASIVLVGGIAVPFLVVHQVKQKRASLANAR